MLALISLPLLAPAAAFAKDAANVSPNAAATNTPSTSGHAAASEGADPGVIIVTASARPVERFDTSISVSVLDDEAVLRGVARSTAEIFRQIPGVRSEATGGEGNANIAVRGLPVASGGAKFLQLQEDGLPILQFGDIAFGNTDIFLRADRTIASIQAVRGGSASTFASNSPGGVINLLSKTGAEEGGLIQARVGVDYEEYRLDFDYGGRLGPNTRFNLGGFWRRGEGPRDAGYDGNRGYQVKANLTQEFGTGYVRLYVKRLDDRAVGYLPMPVAVTGTDRNPDYRSLSGFDIKSGALQSALFTRDVGLDGLNRPHETDVRDGMHPVTTALGFEAAFEPAEGFHVENRFRWSKAKGRFVSPFPAEVGSAADLANSVGRSLDDPAGAYGLVYANGPQAGQAYGAGAGSGPILRIHLFNVDVNSLDSVVNDLKLTRGWGPVSVTAGFYKARQDIAMDWVWNSYLMEARSGNAALLDVARADGTVLTSGGLYAYGVPFWGNCCQRSYDVRYHIDAPYLSGTAEFGALTLDANARHDHVRVRGSYFGPAKASNLDVDGGGTIEPVERDVSIIDLATRNPVRYGVGYWSWSLGANYRLGEDAALFARASRGGRANADRLLYGRVGADGSVLRANAVDFVDQYELGAKLRSGPLSLYVTGFQARTQEQNYEATTQRTLDRTYKATGVELEAGWRAGVLDLSAGATWTRARIAKDAITPAHEGNRPRRQASLIYQASATLDLSPVRAGLNLLGTTRSFTQDDNQLVLPGFAQVNAVAQVTVLGRVDLAVEVNNLFDTMGFTEAEEGSIPSNGVVRARSINGRTVSVSATSAF